MGKQDRKKERLEAELSELRRRLARLEQTACGALRPDGTAQVGDCDFAEMVETMPEAVFVHCGARLVYANRAGFELLGASTREDLIGRPVWEFVHEECLDGVRRAVDQVELERRRHPLTEERVIRLDGLAVDVEVAATPVVYRGEPAVQLVMHDISKRKRVVSALHEARRELESRVSQRTLELVVANERLQREIEERRHAEEALHLQRIYFQQLFANSPEGIAILDNDDRVIDVNKGFGSLFQYSIEEARGRLINDLIVPRDSIQEAVDLSARVLKGQVVECETVRTRKDGSSVDVSILGYPVTSSGEQIGVYGIYRDIGERRQAQEALRESYETLVTVLDGIDADVYVADMDTHEILLMNKHMKESFGQELVGKICWQEFRREDGPCPHCTNAKLLDAEGKPTGVCIWECENPVTLRWYINHDRAIRWVDGRLVRLQIATDITQLKATERVLRQQKYYLDALHETSLGLIGRLDLNDLLETIISRAAVLAGTPHAYIDLLAPGGDEMEIKLGMGVYSRHVGVRTKPGEGVVGKVWKTGRQIWVEDYQCWDGRSPDRRWDVLRAAGGLPLKFRAEVLGVIGVAHTDRDKKFDEKQVAILNQFAELASIALINARLYAALQSELTERKRAEAALKQSEQRYRSVVDQSSDCIYLVDLDDRRVLEANPALSSLLGYTHEELLTLNVYDFVAHEKDDIDRIIDLTVSKRSHFIGERCYRRKDGTKVEVEVNANVISYGGTEVLCVVCRDISERKRLEQELLKAQKLESLGVLAGGLAHDFNNLLMGILGNIDLARFYTIPGDLVSERLEEAMRASLRAKDLARQLLTFSKGGAPIKRPSSLAAILRDSAKFALSGSNVRCELDLPGDLWTVEADEGQISQVVNNLLINAVQAMPDGGVIQVTAANTLLSAMQEVPLIPGKYVTVTIEDSGAGIAREYLSKVFDPYFTTKQKGSGLGLATAYSIIKRHDGYITVESEPGVGTTFRFYLPTSLWKTRDEGVLEGNPLEGQGRILVMDDEQSVREVAGRMLERLGFQVEFAPDGDTAVELYRHAKESGNPFDVVIMDLTVPAGAGGKEAVKKLLKIDAQVNAVVSSGYSNDPVISDYEAHGFKGIVTKPYGMTELSRVLHKLLKNNQKASHS